MHLRKPGWSVLMAVSSVQSGSVPLARVNEGLRLTVASVLAVAVDSSAPPKPVSPERLGARARALAAPPGGGLPPPTPISDSKRRFCRISSSVGPLGGSGAACACASGLVSGQAMPSGSLRPPAHSMKRSSALGGSARETLKSGVESGRFCSSSWATGFFSPEKKPASLSAP